MTAAAQICRAAAGNRRAKVRVSNRIYYCLPGCIFAGGYLGEAALPEALAVSACAAGGLSIYEAILLDLSPDIWLSLSNCAGVSMALRSVRLYRGLPVIILGLAEGVWITGFDIIYGCQDVEFDKRNSLYSIPVRFGIKKALRIFVIMHWLSVGCFAAAGILADLSLVYQSGVVLAGCVLAY